MTDEKVETIVNKSKSYLLPLLSKHIGVEFLYELDNTFINIDNLVECIGLLYTKNVNFNIVRYFNKLRQHPLYINEKVLDKHILFIFKFPEEYLNEYKYFHLGRYSRFSDEAKKTIISFMSNNYQYPNIVEDVVHILYKNKARKEKIEIELGIKLDDDAELTSVIDEDEETFNTEKYEYTNSK